MADWHVYCVVDDDDINLRQCLTTVFHSQLVLRQESSK